MSKESITEACFNVVEFELEEVTSCEEVSKAAIALSVNAKAGLHEHVAFDADTMIARLAAWVMTRTVTDRQFRVSVQYPKTWVDHLFLWLGGRFAKRVRWIEKSTVVTAEIREAYPQYELPELPDRDLGKPVRFSRLRWPHDCYPPNHRTSAQMNIEEVRDEHGTE